MTQGDGSSGPEVGGPVTKPAAKRNPLLLGMAIFGGVLVAGAIGIGLLIEGGSSDDPLVGAASTTEPTSETTVTTTATTSTVDVDEGGVTEPILGWYWKLEAVHTVGVVDAEEFTQTLFIVLEFDDSQDLAEMKPRYVITAPGLIRRSETNMIDSAQCLHTAEAGNVVVLESDFFTAEQIGFLEFDLTGKPLTYRALFITTAPEWEITQICPGSEGGSDGGDNVTWVSQGPHTGFGLEIVGGIKGELELGNDVGFSISEWTVIQCEIEKTGNSGELLKLCFDDLVLP